MFRVDRQQSRGEVATGFASGLVFFELLDATQSHLERVA
jgi:hypothetical protein